MRCSLFTSLALTIPALAVATNAHAAPVTIYFETTITSINSDPEGLWAANGVSVGSTYSGSFSYDDASTNLFDNSLNFDSWAMSSFSMNIPGSGTVSPLRISATADAPEDVWRALASFTLPGASDSGFIRLSVRGDLGIDVSDVDQGFGNPIIGPPILDAVTTSSSIDYPGSSPFSLSGLALANTVFSTTAPSVPEPAAFGLFGIGLLLVTARRRRHGSGHGDGIAVIWSCPGLGPGIAQ